MNMDITTPQVDEEHDEEMVFPVYVTRQYWDGDNAIDLDEVVFDLAPYIYTTPYSRRWTEFGDPGAPGALDYWVDQAVDEGLIPQSGPYAASSPALEEFVREYQEEGLHRLPRRQEPVAKLGTPLSGPLTLEEIAEIAVDGRIAVTLKIDLESLISARSNGNEDDDENDVLGRQLSSDNFLVSDPSYVLRKVVTPGDESNTVLLDFYTDIEPTLDIEQIDHTPAQLREMLSRNRPVPNQDETLAEFLEETFDFTIESLALTRVEPKELLAELQRRNKVFVQNTSTPENIVTFATTQIFAYQSVVYHNLLVQEGYRTVEIPLDETSSPQTLIELLNRGFQFTRRLQVIQSQIEAHRKGRHHI